MLDKEASVTIVSREDNGARGLSPKTQFDALREEFTSECPDQQSV